MTDDDPKEKVKVQSPPPQLHSFSTHLVIHLLPPALSESFSVDSIRLDALLQVRKIRKEFGRLFCIVQERLLEFSPDSQSLLLWLRYGVCINFAVVDCETKGGTTSILNSS